jgi:RNA polymerase sigma-70 factor (ECF subfamily)
MTAACSESTVDLILGQEPNLRLVARRLARCESDADDLVQETLLRAYLARDRFRPGTSVRAWTATILRRQFLSGQLRAKRRRVQTDTDAGWPLDAAIVRNPLRDHDHAAGLHAIANHVDDRVKRALDNIPERFRKAFLLSALWELSCEEIGQQLGVPIGTVMSRVHRARQHLRGVLVPSRRPLPTQVAQAGG